MEPLMRLRKYLETQLQKLSNDEDELYFHMDNEHDEKKLESMYSELSFVIGLKTAYMFEIEVVRELIKATEPAEKTIPCKRNPAWLKTLIGKPRRG
jgi:hypothetical protein